MSGIPVHSTSPINNHVSEATVSSTLPKASDTPDSLQTNTISEVSLGQQNTEQPPAPDLSAMGTAPVVGSTRTTQKNNVTSGAGVASPDSSRRAAAAGFPSSTASQAPTQGTPSSQTHDLSHPPGYRQQESSFQDQITSDSGDASFGSSQLPRDSSTGLTTAFTTGLTSGDTPLWDSAVSLAKTAGEKLSGTEAQVWKMVNGEK